VQFTLGPTWEQLEQGTTQSLARRWPKGLPHEGAWWHIRRFQGNMEHEPFMLVVPPGAVEAHT